MTADMSKLTHFNQAGEAHMVDVGAKGFSHRIAVAEGTIRMQPATLEMIQRVATERGRTLVSPGLPASWPPSGLPT